MTRILGYILAVFCLISQAIRADSEIKRIDKINRENTIARHFLYDPVGFWKFEEGSGATAIDLSGSGNHGTITGATWATGKIGGGLSFDGVDDYVTISDSASLDSITATITLAVWYKSDNQGNWDIIITKGLGYPNDLYTLGYHSISKSIDCSINFVAAGRQSANYVLNLDDANFHHIVGVYDGTNIKIYIDGVLRETINIGNDTIKTDNNNLRIGNRADGNATKGKIDEVRIYKRALTVDEIQRLYFLGQQ